MGYKNQINVDGTVRSGREWASVLSHSTNYINKYLRKHGLEATVEYIRTALTDGTIERNRQIQTDKMPKMYAYGILRSAKIDEVFRAMVRRCYDKKRRTYGAYGGRGIRICQEWLDDPSRFTTWAMSNGYKPGLTVDRIDVNGNYEPDNCRFVSFSENAKWQRRTHRITLNGITNSASGWERRLGLANGHLKYRIRKYGMEYTIHYIKKMLDKAA